MSLNEVRFLPQCGSTNRYAKEQIEAFGPVAAVYTTDQTDGRGRRGRQWVNAAGQALYYTAVLKVPMVQPETLPLFASLAVREQLRLRYGVDCAIKWPNDLLLGGKKIAGILCEAVSYGTGGEGRAYLCGIGINLAQPQSYFDAAGLPYGTSLALQGARVDLDADPAWLAEGLTDFGFDRGLYTFGPEGFAPYRGSTGRAASSSAPTAGKSTSLPARCRSAASTVPYNPYKKSRPGDMRARPGHIQGNLAQRVCEPPRGECAVLCQILSPGGY